ncbi:MAG: DUF5686 family protein, partial [Bacteroidia bacterium]
MQVTKNNCYILLYFHLLFLLIIPSVYSQTINGRILEEQTGKEIPFVFVKEKGTNNGVTCDIDGRFKLSVKSFPATFQFQIIGYESKEININEFNAASELKIYLKPTSFVLDEISVSPKENPANELIRQLIKNKSKHDPHKLPFYSCHTYAKTYFTISDKNGDENYYTKLDTAKNKDEINLVKKQYLFLLETSSLRKYLFKNIHQEKILASKVSGFKSAPFASMASQLQSFSFYDNSIEVLGIKYVNPIQKGTFRRYNFEIEDTIIQNSDTTILIRFNPKPDPTFKGLKGVIYINKAHVAISNVIASPIESQSEENNIRIQQQYSMVGEHWFPSQLNTEIIFTSAKINSSDNSKSNFIKCVSKVYIDDVNLDSIIKIKRKNTVVLTEKGYESKDDNYWDYIRIDSLSEKEKRTYVKIDSIGKAQKFEQKIKLLKIMSTGLIPIGVFGIDINRILKVNDYEGVRLGCGVKTNEKLSNWFQIGAFGGYGFRDKAFKYGGELSLFADKNKNQFLKFELYRDLQESGNFSFYGANNSLFSTERIRTLMVNKMDAVSAFKASINTSFFNVFKSSLYLSVSEMTTPFGYGSPEKKYEDVINKFTNNEIGINIKYWPFEKYAESFLGLVSLGSKWPCFYLNVSQSMLDKVQDYQSKFYYSKIDFKIVQNIPFKIKGYFKYALQAGKVFGNVPYSLQFNNNPSRANNYPVSADNSFETMYYNER